MRNQTRRGHVLLSAGIVAVVAVATILLVLATSPGTGDMTPSPSSAAHASDGASAAASASPATLESPESSTSEPPPAASTDYLLMPGSEVMALPTSGPAWDYLVQTAKARWPAPDFRDQDNQTGTLAFGAALVYARTGDESMRAKARDAIMAVIPTFRDSDLGPGLGPLRQTAGWVLAADFAGLEGEDDAAFREFLQRVLSDRTGTHSRWNHVVAAHDDSANNWGAWAGAARISALLYLDESLDDAVNTFRGFLGDRDAWSRFLRPGVAAQWACDPSPTRFTPVNGDCQRSGINLDGAVVADISRGSERLVWPPATNGIMYTHETIAGYMLQAELLYRNGYPEVWGFENDALRRMADVISRSEQAGGPGWNPGRVQMHIAWLLNARYDTTYPTEPAEYGRSFGFTDWLYGS